MRRMASCVMGLLMAACTATGHSSYVASMQRYQGMSEAQLIEALGPPDNAYETGGVKYLTYSKVNQYVDSSGMGFGYGGYPRHGGGVWVDQDFGGGGSVRTYRCDIFFMIRNRVVEKVGHRGNGC